MRRGQVEITGSVLASGAGSDLRRSYFESRRGRTGRTIVRADMRLRCPLIRALETRTSVRLDQRDRAGMPKFQGLREFDDRLLAV